MALPVHLDTDFGGDPDDACALAMLLGYPEVEIVGITTTLDRIGLRAAYVRHVLSLAVRRRIPVAVGAAVSLTTRAVADPVIDDERHWPEDIVPIPSTSGAALDLLARSVAVGATIIAIGPLTNLANLEIMRPGLLARVPTVAMGGWIRPPADGFPAWGPEMDFNLQWDTRAAQIVLGSANLTLVTLPATLAAHLKAADLPRLRASGSLGVLLANQSAAHAQDHGMTALGRAHHGLPDDLLNFHYDPVACAVAIGWPGAIVENARLTTVLRDGLLHTLPDPEGRQMRIVTDIDGDSFSEFWLSAVEAAQR